MQAASIDAKSGDKRALDDDDGPGTEPDEERETADEDYEEGQGAQDAAPRLRTLNIDATGEKRQAEGAGPSREQRQRGDGGAALDDEAQRYLRDAEVLLSSAKEADPGDLGELQRKIVLFRQDNSYALEPERIVQLSTVSLRLNRAQLALDSEATQAPELKDDPTVNVQVNQAQSGSEKADDPSDAERETEDESDLELENAAEQTVLALGETERDVPERESESEPEREPESQLGAGAPGAFDEQGM